MLLHYYIILSCKTEKREENHHHEISYGSQRKLLCQIFFPILIVTMIDHFSEFVFTILSCYMLIITRVDYHEPYCWNDEDFLNGQSFQNDLLRCQQCANTRILRRHMFRVKTIQFRLISGQTSEVIFSFLKLTRTIQIELVI